MGGPRGAVVVAAAVLLLAVQGCAEGEPTTYGPTSAGPTRSSKPRASGPADIPSSAVTQGTRAPARRLCDLFTPAEISVWLGRRVGPGSTSMQGPYVTCTWQTVAVIPNEVQGRGRVTITRSDGKFVAAFERTMTAEAKRKRAGGRKDLGGVGDGGFAIGAFVKGVPIWYGLAVHSGSMTAAEMSGVKTKASVATLGDFLVEAIDRS